MNTKDFNFKKKYGQNFLRDNSIPRKIVDVSKIPGNRDRSWSWCFN